MKTTYKIGGMTCGGCASSITKALQSLDTEAEITVDLDKGSITVTGLTPTTIEQAVEDAGFDFGGAV